MLTNENLLDEWVRGHAEQAKGVIVGLVWRLASVSCPKPLERRFPLSDSIGQRGPDGVLDATISFDPFVPEGYSYWEVGTGLDAGAKATKDYRELTASVPADRRDRAVFIFVTPLSGRRDWPYTWKKDAQAAWLAKRRAKKEWKDVRIIDGTRLIDWLSHFPALDMWLAQQISNIPSSQVETPDQHWSVLRSIGEPPPLIPDLFLENRSEASAKLKEVLDGTTSKLTLKTHFQDQVVDFVSAYLASLVEESRIDVLGRCLIVSGPEGWNSICDNPQWKNHVLIADAQLDLSGDTGTRLIQKARQAGHAVIFGGQHGGIPDPASVALSTPQSYQIEEVLRKAGYKDERARALAQRSGGNLSSLLRCIQNLSVLPAWAERTDAAELAIAVLLGSWNDASPADQAVVENVSGKAFGEWIRDMREVVVSPATPLIRRDGNWKFIPRYEGWYSLGPHIFDADLDRLQAAAISVLRQNDPKFQLPEDQRFAASVHGKALPHSRTLRTGLAEGLALLGSHPKALISCSLGKPEGVATLAVRDVLEEADWIRWASLNDLLPFLAEAAPNEFLNAVEDALQIEPCPFEVLFAQEEGALFGSNYLTGVLWGLETLAWDPVYLNRAVTALGELAALDPGGKSGNRPASSLTTIFLPWFPQTCAPIDKRIAAVKSLLNEFPDVGWKLLVSLMPQQQSWSSGVRRPTWRPTIPDDWHDGSTVGEYWEQILAYAALALESAKKDVLKLDLLIEGLDHLPPTAREQLLDFLKSETIRALPTEDRLPIWNKLTDLVTRHRRSPDAEWAMPPEYVDDIAAVADALTPETPFYLHQRLFSERDFHLYEEKGNYQEQMQELEMRRQIAVAEVEKKGGVEAVIDFAKAVQSPWRVGIAYGFVARLDDDRALLPDLIESNVEALTNFVGGFVWGRFRDRGWQWVDNNPVAHWKRSEIGRFLSFLPFTPDTWDRVEVLLGEDQSEYWSHAVVNPYEPATGLEQAIDQLIKYGRALAAIRCLHKIVLDKQPFNTKQAARALFEVLGATDSPSTIDTHEVTEIIGALQDDGGTDPQDLFRIEWSYLPLLDGYHGVRPKLLWRRLAEDPAFYCEIIRLVFRSKKQPQTEAEVSEDKRKIATNAYRLLDEWAKPPGLLDDGSLDGAALRKWLNAVKTECTESGHLDIAMTMFGHVLTYVPADPDGLWIHRSAADILNSKDAKNIRTGFETEIFNSRGVHFMDPTGKPEMELAAKYRKQADAVDDAGYHRLAVTLRDLAESYVREAERNSRRDFSDD